MDKNTISENEIYKQYQNLILPYIMELEVRDGEYPVEILNEIRAIFTHLSRYKLQNEQGEVFSAGRHVKRAVLDCYKYLCISMAEEVSTFRSEYRKVDLKLADNGKFLPELNRLENIAKDSFKKAKTSEIKKNDDDTQYPLFETAYNAYCEVSQYIKDSHEAILFASSHSKKSNALTFISCVIGVIGIISTVIAII